MDCSIQSDDLLEYEIGSKSEGFLSLSLLMFVSPLSLLGNKQLPGPSGIIIVAPNSSQLVEGSLHSIG